MKGLQSTLSMFAVLFGLLTIFAAIVILLAVDSGYRIFQPLLIFNLPLGFAYISAGIITYRHCKQGMYVAAGIFSINFVALVVIAILYTNEAAIALESLLAMSFRTFVWLVLLAGLGWLNDKEGVMMPSTRHNKWGSGLQALIKAR